MSIGTKQVCLIGAGAGFILGLASFACAQVGEGFENGVPTSATATSADYTLGSGVWSIQKGQRTTTRRSGTYGLNLTNGSSAASFAVTPAQASVSTVTFWARGSGASSLRFQVSVGGGAYTEIGAQAITSSFAAYTVNVNASGAVRLRFQNITSQTHYIDDVTINGSGSLTPTATPIASAQPTATPRATPTPTATARATPRSTATPRVTATPTPTPVPTATPTVPPAGSYDAVVALDGSGQYTSVQAAINAAPDNGSSWHTIYIKSGAYRQVLDIPASKTHLRLIGQSAANTILTYDHSSSSAGGTGASSSTFIRPSDFIAENLWFENAFDYPSSSVSNKQAVAAQPLGDRQIYKNCRFTGYQDTLYVRAGRQYFKGCYIQGHTDFIFGEGTAFFDGCQIHSLYKSGASISAPSTLEATNYGLVFRNCTLTADPTLAANTVYLGRPWHPSSVTVPVRSMAVFLFSSLAAHVKTDGWTCMSSNCPATERMYEYQNTGAGAVINASRPQSSTAEAAAYTVSTVMGGADGWDPTIY